MSGAKGGAGARRVRIKIQNNPRPDDGHGGQDNTDAAWVDKLTSFASMRQMRAGEVFRNRRIESDQFYKFELTFPLAVTVLFTDRILVIESGLTLNIRGVDNVDQRNRKMVITAEAGVTD